VKCALENGRIKGFDRLYSPGYDWVHVGVYGYSGKNLKRYLELGESVSERTYRLEQLRWPEPLAAIEVDYNGIGVDRPEHINKVEERLA